MPLDQAVLIIVSSLIIVWAVHRYAYIQTKRLLHLGYDFVYYFTQNCGSLDYYRNKGKHLSVAFGSNYIELRANRDKWFLSSNSKITIGSLIYFYETASAFTDDSAPFLSLDHYLSYSECMNFKERVLEVEEAMKASITDKCRKYIEEKVGSIEFVTFPHEKLCHLNFLMMRIRHNREFMNKELTDNKDFFDNVLPYPLDSQQRKSIVILEDNCLVISSAGSGKTSTSVGKIKYLIERRGIEPSKILPLTYTTKAANELTERLGLKDKGLECHTFHSLARSIIISLTKRTPSICDRGLMLQCFYYLVDNHPDFKKAINSFITVENSLIKNLHDYTYPEQYYRDRSIYGIQAPFKDRENKIIFTRSEEERKICTFLSLNGVSFRYEQPYFKDTTDEFKRQYKPDFTIYTDDNRFVILEHFGIDKNDNVPKWFGVGHESGKEIRLGVRESPYEAANREYNEGIEWKRRINRHYGVRLLETTSAMFHDGTVFQRLTEQLQEMGIRLRPLTEEEKFEKLVRRNKHMEDSLLQLITTFITLIKSNRKTPEDILKTISNEKHDNPAFEKRSRFIIDNIFIPFYNEYQKELKEKKQMDYVDLIIEATHLCNSSDFKSKYEMILVDEFQDISVDRFELIQALRRKTPLTKLFAVGDDWQSIFRFSGSDLTLFNSFEDFFGYTERCKIECTYRFGQPLISKSTNFILQNTFQVPKEVKSNDPAIVTELSFHEYKVEEGEQLKKLKEILSVINATEEVMLIGRYHKDTDFIPSSYVISRNESGEVTKVRIDGREMEFNTIHSAKGLEAEHVILVNCSQDGNGFPSKITDDPILGYVLSKPEDFPFPEERRLFYVAITRAKKHAYVMYKDTCPSLFITDIEKDRNVETMGCPWCKNGFLKPRAEGTNDNGTKWRLYGCSNKAAGCQYKWTVRFRPDNECTIQTQFAQVKRKSRMYVIPSLSSNTEAGSDQPPYPLELAPAAPMIDIPSRYKAEETYDDDLPF